MLIGDDMAYPNYTFFASAPADQIVNAKNLTAADQQLNNPSAGQEPTLSNVEFNAVGGVEQGLNVIGKLLENVARTKNSDQLRDLIGKFNNCQAEIRSITQGPAAEVEAEKSSIPTPTP